MAVSQSTLPGMKMVSAKAQLETFCGFPSTFHPARQPDSAPQRDESEGEESHREGLFDEVRITMGKQEI
jgi:hypothetical protein